MCFHYYYLGWKMAGSAADAPRPTRMPRSAAGHVGNASPMPEPICTENPTFSAELLQKTDGKTHQNRAITQGLRAYFAPITRALLVQRPRPQPL
jgi:hypothetical protein